MSYLLLSRQLHFVFIIVELGSGEAGCHHAGHGFIKPGCFTKLLHLSLSFPFSHVTPSNMFISVYKTCGKCCKNQTIQAYSRRKGLCETVSHKLYQFTKTLYTQSLYTVSQKLMRDNNSFK